ncbi:MAG: UTP--glucose-1-phosphate uridylyltransferase [Verrucomicrobiaceae bacterium]|nr:MAG: UTP--glucose-1-phosphate uridylyltransferase [Verrucomicrobiaceae bacterium]
MKITKAVITAASRHQHHLPLQTLVDSDGESKSALAIILEEVERAGVDEIAVVVAPGDANAYRTAAGPHANRLTFIEQPSPLGYAHAVWCAREFTGNAPFLLLVGDHLYTSGTERGCAQQLVELAEKENCAVSAVHATHESKLPYYGAIGGRRVSNRGGIYEVTEVLEKPTPTQAEQHLLVPGLRAGHYLCFFGMHVLTPSVMELVETSINGTPGDRKPLSPALAELSRRERYLALEVEGRRYDIGAKYGLLTAQLALALEGRDRDEVLSGLLELLATKSKGA